MAAPADKRWRRGGARAYTGRLPLLEAVPNLSEGRRPDLIASLAAAARAAGGAHLIGVSSDADHNRTVLTLVGEAKALVEAMLAVYGVAIGSIDLGRQRGVHPRIGAVDVVPFVPLAGAGMADAVAAARALGAAVAERHGLAVYLYERAATRPARRNLADIRRGGLEGLAARLAEGAWEPDFGPARIDPRAGVTVVGARDFLIAFNAELATAEGAVARRIAARVREAGGGLPAVKALGLYLEGRGRAQVSMNLTDFRTTPLAAAFAAVSREAAAEGTEVVATEIVGLAPEAALDGTTPEALRLRDFGPELLLETHLRRLGLTT